MDTRSVRRWAEVFPDDVTTTSPPAPRSQAVSAAGLVRSPVPEPGEPCAAEIRLTLELRLLDSPDVAGRAVASPTPPLSDTRCSPARHTLPAARTWAALPLLLWSGPRSRTKSTWPRPPRLLVFPVNEGTLPTLAPENHSRASVTSPGLESDA